MLSLPNSKTRKPPVSNANSFSPQLSLGDTDMRSSGLAQYFNGFLLSSMVALLCSPGEQPNSNLTTS